MLRGWCVMDPSPLAVGLGFLAFAALTLALLALFALLSHDHIADAPMPTGCNATNPHVMLPTSYGWRCANDCGESWYVDPQDALAIADLALWERESGWVK